MTKKIKLFVNLELEKSDSGYYTCVASSISGKSTWAAQLRVESPTNPNINFFRAPDPLAFPGVPSRPQIVNKTEDSATITWTRSPKIGASSLLGYQVSLLIVAAFFSKFEHLSAIN